MRSIKPGRGPSAMGAIGGIFAIIFGIGWTILAFAITRNSPFPVVGILFPLFGICFVCLGILNVAYNIRNTVSKNRFSVLDVTSHQEEPDPLNQRFGPEQPPRRTPQTSSAKPVNERLAELDQLKASRSISEAEYQFQRQRILDQL
jgi:hypothetical protein